MIIFRGGRDRNSKIPCIFIPPVLSLRPNRKLHGKLVLAFGTEFLAAWSCSYIWMGRHFLHKTRCISLVENGFPPLLTGSSKSLLVRHLGCRHLSADWLLSPSVLCKIRPHIMSTIDLIFCWSALGLRLNSESYEADVFALHNVCS